MSPFASFGLLLSKYLLNMYRNAKNAKAAPKHLTNIPRNNKNSHNR